MRPARARLKAIARDKNKPMEERFAAALKLAQLPRNSSATRIRNRCEVTGRPRGFYRKLKMCRIALRELGSQGPDPRPREVELVRRIDDGMNDPLGDMLTRIRNAQMRSKSKVSTPGSQLRARVLEVLKNEGYIRGYASVEQGRPHGARDRAEVFRRRAGDPRDRARVEAGPAGLFVGEESAAHQQRSRHCRSCRRRRA